MSCVLTKKGRSSVLLESCDIGGQLDILSVLMKFGQKTNEFFEIEFEQ